MSTIQLVSIEERKLIEKSFTKEMGKDVKIKVIDIDKYAAYIKEQREKNNLSPWVDIQPIAEDLHKTPNRMATFQKDPVTGVYYGIAVGQDEFGNIKWQKIQIQDSLNLNLDNINEAKIWAVIRFYPEIKGSPWQVQNPYYQVYDPVASAKREDTEIDEMRKAFTRIDKILSMPKEMVLFARYLGEEINPSSNYEIIKASLFRFAKRNPALFNLKWISKQKSFGQYFESGRQLGIITNDAERGYLFKNISLGLSPEEAINTLSKDGHIMNSLMNEVNDSDKVVQSITANFKGEKDESGNENTGDVKSTENDFE